MEKIKGWITVVACCLWGAFLCPSWAQEKVPVSTAPALTLATSSLADVVSRVLPGVVGVSIGQSRESSSNPLMQDPAFKRFFEESFRDRQRAQQPDAPIEVRPAGSGVIVDASRGLVLTNHHVIRGAAKVVLVLHDRRELDAEVVGSDPGTDVAVLKVKPERLVAVALGDSDAMRIGDVVVAIGNPFGIGQTVTSGIVSAVGRGISPEGYEDYIQTDAAINPGNSGGALINLRGELIGINTAIISAGRGREGAAGNIGIGFAVPSGMAREVMAQILAHGEVKRGRIGIQSDEVTEQLARARGLTSIAGAVVRGVQKGSSADRAGVRINDVVLQVDGRAVRTASDLRNRVALVPVGSSVRLQVWRDRQSLSLQVPVEPISAEQVATSQQSEAAGKAAPSGPKPAAGSALAGVRLSDGREGVVVNSIEQSSSLHAAGLRAGDVILAVNRQALSRVQELSAALAQSGAKTLVVLRGESKLRFNLG